MGGFMNLQYIANSSHLGTVKDILQKKLHISHRLLTTLKRENGIYKNDKPCLVNDIVTFGDKITVFLDYAEDSHNIVPIPMHLSILYEDACYIVINKPSGIPVHPSHLHYTDSLSNGLCYYFQSQNLHKKIRPVNRIDKDTSGIVIFAKNAYIQECLIEQMKHHDFEKTYIAICEGILEGEGMINASIARKENSIMERCIDNKGEIAITHYQSLKAFPEKNYSVIKCQLETGRTHQIRVHMKYIGHPLLGDTLYSHSSPFIARQALHSYQVAFRHPVTQEQVTYTAPLPEDMKKISQQN